MTDSMHLADAAWYARSHILDRAFDEFHKSNPSVYRKLVELARDLARRGHKRIGMKMLVEVLRWQHHLETTDVSGYKLNNNHASRYARLIMSTESDLAEIFEVRALADEKGTSNE